MAASFSHPNIVPVYAVEESDDLLAFAMAYVEGESLGERVQRGGPLSVRDTVRLLQDVAYALAYADGRGVVHRDIKPDNIMIERSTGRALVMDFGVSRAISAPALPAAEGLTRVGEVVGTPEYMSPEQASGDDVDGRSDICSLGLTSYVALVGESVMRADSTGRMLARQITEVPPLVSTLRGDVPTKLAEAIERCVAKDPAHRFARAENLVEALEEAQLVGPVNSAAGTALHPGGELAVARDDVRRLRPRAARAHVGAVRTDEPRQPAPGAAARRCAGDAPAPDGERGATSRLHGVLAH